MLARWKINTNWDLCRNTRRKSKQAPTEKNRENFKTKFKTCLNKHPQRTGFHTHTQREIDEIETKRIKNLKKSALRLRSERLFFAAVINVHDCTRVSRKLQAGSACKSLAKRLPKTQWHSISARTVRFCVFLADGKKSLGRELLSLQCPHDASGEIKSPNGWNARGRQ